MSFRKNVFVLGAGFSADTGAPLMNDFFNRVRNLRDDLRSILSSRDREVFERVIQYRFDLNSALAKVFVDLDNIEQLFGFLEMEVQLSPSAKAGLRTDMVHLIVRTLEASTEAPLATGDCRVVAGPKGGNKWSYYYLKNPYSFFVGFAAGLWNPLKRKGTEMDSARSDAVAPQRSIDCVITFNYDLVLEREMRGLGIVPLYQCPAGDYRDAFPGANLGLNLLKMHGSANG